MYQNIGTETFRIPSACLGLGLGFTLLRLRPDFSLARLRHRFYPKPKLKLRFSHAWVHGIQRVSIPKKMHYQWI
jgi:hypothetical protein